jgi:uncharacterized protein
MIERRNYIEQLKPFIDKPLIKVITGIRRSGKSTVLKLLIEELVKNGINSEQIVYVNLESFMFSELREAKDLYLYIKEQIKGTGKHYLLLDEIQEVHEWEKAVNSFLVDFDVDIYITGSNSHLLSSELATYIAGRYVEIQIYTLSYREYLSFKNNYPISKEKAQDSFQNYLSLGGFPIVHVSDYQEESAYKIVYDIYSSILLRDTVQRYKIRDTELLERVVKYTFNNIGNTFSGKNVADYFKSQQRKIDLNTVYNYLHALEGAFILHKVSRYDIKGKEILKTQEKYFLGDISLLYAIMGFRSSMISGLLENLVYLELKRRGYSVYIGKLDQCEIDFVAEKRTEKIYIQVAYKLENQETINREYSPLLAIKDQYPKFVITMDDFWSENIDGVTHQHIRDFLLNSI